MAEWWAEEVRQIRHQYMKIVIPNPRCMPVDYIGMRGISWFNFKNVSYPQPGKDMVAMENATTYIQYLINKEIASGIKSERIVVAGIRQGAFMALHAALSFPKRLGCIVALSPWKLEDDVLDNHKTLNFKEINRNIPIFHAHIYDDHVMPNDKAREFTQYLKDKYSTDVVYHQYVYNHILTGTQYGDLVSYFEKLFGPSYVKKNH